MPKGTLSKKMHCGQNPEEGGGQETQSSNSCVQCARSCPGRTSWHLPRSQPTDKHPTEGWADAAVPLVHTTWHYNLPTECATAVRHPESLLCKLGIKMQNARGFMWHFRMLSDDYLGGGNTSCPEPKAGQQPVQGSNGVRNFFLKKWKSCFFFKGWVDGCHTYTWFSSPWCRSVRSMQKYADVFNHFSCCFFIEPLGLENFFLV